VKTIRHWIRAEDGQDMVEYGLLAAFISIVSVLTVRAFGPLITPFYDRVQAAFT
jgi:Flp pilus assembly pilin Flp